MMATVVSGWQRNSEPDSYWLSVLGRLRPGTRPEQATAALLPLTAPSWTARSRDARRRSGSAQEDPGRHLGAAGRQGVNVLRDEFQTPLVVLGVMVALVLAIACANVANLLMARATARARDTAVRLAAGASAWQLARQSLVEGALLSIAGGLAGLLLAQLLAAGLLRLLPADLASGWISPEISAPMLLASLAVTAVAGLLFSVAPAIQAARTDIAPVLKAQTSGMSASGSHARARQALVAAQICLSLLLVVGAGLFTRTLVNLMRSSPGFRPERLITFSIDPALSGYQEEARYALFRELEQRLAASRAQRPRRARSSRRSPGGAGATGSRRRGRSTAANT